jgi:hypothetical protein
MTRRIDYRRRLLRAVDLFLEQTPEATVRAERAVRRCLKTLSAHPLDELMWWGIAVPLSDTVYTRDVEYLADLQRQLASGRIAAERIYLDMDLRDELTEVHARWYEGLQALAAFVGRFPRLDVESAVPEYRRLVKAVRSVEAEMPEVPEGDETLTYLILAEVSLILTEIHVDLSLRLYHYLAPTGSYGHLQLRRDDEPPRAPDASDTVVWAQRALDAIAGRARLLIVKEMWGPLIRLSFH